MSKQGRIHAELSDENFDFFEAEMKHFGVKQPTPMLNMLISVVRALKYEDPERFLQLLSSPQPPWKRREESQTESPAGYVYLFALGEEFKIGFSRDPETRLRTLQAGAAAELKLEHLIACRADEMPAIEFSLHERFKHKRTRGEWFRLDEVDVEWIKSVKTGGVA